MKAFISYSHHDSELLEKLTTHLAVLRRDKLLDTWTDRKIDAGALIDAEVSRAMEEAELFLLLVSASFINSDYCFAKEFARACERQADGEVTIVPIIVRDCSWKIKELSKFKALPEDGKAVMGRHWHTPDEAFTNITDGLRKVIEKRAKTRAKDPQAKAQSEFIADERHVSLEQRNELRAILGEIVNRLANAGTLPDDEARKKTSMWFGIVWKQFNDVFGIEEHGLRSLPHERFAEAKSWLLQYRASKDKNLKSVNPQRYRNTLTKTIYTGIRSLGWTKEQLYTFAAAKLECTTPITSLNDLGNNQLETLRDRVRYELTKLKTMSGRAKSRPKFITPTLPEAKELLDTIIAHPVPDERGLTQILLESPAGPFLAEYIPNTTRRGTPISIKKSLLLSAIADLCRLGWLLPPVESENCCVYELNSSASDS